MKSTVLLLLVTIFSHFVAISQDTSTITKTEIKSFYVANIETSPFNKGPNVAGYPIGKCDARRCTVKKVKISLVDISKVYEMKISIDMQEAIPYQPDTWVDGEIFSVEIKTHADGHKASFQADTVCECKNDN